jgi:hypothetical protein
VSNSLSTIGPPSNSKVGLQHDRDDSGCAANRRADRDLRDDDRPACAKDDGIRDEQRSNRRTQEVDLELHGDDVLVVIHHRQRGVATGVVGDGRDRRRVKVAVLLGDEVGEGEIDLDSAGFPAEPAADRSHQPLSAEADLDLLAKCHRRDDTRRSALASWIVVHGLPLRRCDAKRALEPAMQVALIREAQLRRDNGDGRSACQTSSGFLETHVQVIGVER